MIRAYKFLLRPTVRQAQAQAQAQAEMLRDHCALYNGAFPLRLAHLAHLAAGSAEAERRPGDTTADFSTFFQLHTGTRTGGVPDGDAVTSPGKHGRGAPRRCAEPLFAQADLPLSGRS